MKFEEIFKENGLYTTDDLLPEKHRALVYADLFKKTYRKVFTRQSLFKKK